MNGSNRNSHCSTESYMKLKGILTLFFLLYFSIVTIAQVPDAFSYQTVLRNSSGMIIANQSLQMRIIILQDSINGTEVYSETHSTTSNDYGLINLIVGEGTFVSGEFDWIDWASASYYIKIEIDISSTGNFVEMGITRILSVPYALEAKKTTSLVLTDSAGVQWMVYATQNGDLQTQVLWRCSDTLIDDRDGQAYTTVRIGSQCWMRQNLNIGTMIAGTSNQTDDDEIEKYCYNNSEDSCTVYGGFYQWGEAMQYVTDTTTQGICPVGWHLPSESEWCLLENKVDIGTIDCNSVDWIGIDAGGNMKETGNTHWDPPNTGATNSSGFTALGTGYRDYNGNFNYLGNSTYFYSSSEFSASFAWFRTLHWDHSEIGRNSTNKGYGLSVRCVKD